MIGTIYTSRDGGFSSSDGGDFSQLGAFIGQNTNLTMLDVAWIQYVDEAFDVTTIIEFFEGIRRNTSIHKLRLRSCNIVIGVIHEILRVYQENNNLTDLDIVDEAVASFQNGGDQVVASMLARCTNLKRIDLSYCNITDEQLLPMVEAARGHNSLEDLRLDENQIGNSGCVALATLLEEPNCNLQQLELSNNAIGNEGATALANGLTNNTKLRVLNLGYNPIDPSVEDAFLKFLCNTSSINNIYSSNHTLQHLNLPFDPYDAELDRMLRFNKLQFNRLGSFNKSHVAIFKIVFRHSNWDMEPLFEWNMEGDGERDIKALPYIISWLDRAEETIGHGVQTNKMKLSSIYQFAKAMPLLFVPTSHIKGNENKRKRGD